MLGELAALGASQRGGRSVFLLPTWALVNEQVDRFTRMYEDLGIRATGEISDQLPEFVRGQFDIVLLTYEKFTGFALASSHILQLVSVIVVDEVQTLVDTGRGPLLELLLTAIKALREDGILPQLVCLSAVLGDLGGLDTWLEAQALRWTKRPVSLTEGILRADGTFRFLDDGAERQEQLLPPQYRQRAQDFLIPLVSTLVSAGQQVIVFRNQRGTARGSAGYLSQALGLPAATDAIDALPTGDPNVISQELRQCLRGGVACPCSSSWAYQGRLFHSRTSLALPCPGRPISTWPPTALPVRRRSLGGASDEDLMPCVGERVDAVTRLRHWANLASSSSADVPTLDQLLPPPVD